ncbi:hypothetical protein C7H19_11060 [Aphanothece hegewaldii CCALA 016]|uniref:Uncharacterized protein n=1 Tax=Aphanothece hegewaldii CCALA 016 TaxID=2107694 RepID=A0A2T1LXY9_9CHRO|nr:hypothetical protein [Aphanothece hegewaldii]PSF37252.1 hypothetical protein C7H19_11060 [Aphanothece hegewaldii CCALA 016]
MLKSYPLISLSFAFFLLLSNSSNALSQDNLTSLNKITFDLSGISADGLVGSSNNLRSIDYEFCIPRDEQFLSEIIAIDPIIQYYPHSRGRIGCNNNEYLCIGNTHNPKWKEILQAIAKLDYVKKIAQTDWE